MEHMLAVMFKGYYLLQEPIKIKPTLLSVEWNIITEHRKNNELIPRCSLFFSEQDFTFELTFWLEALLKAETGNPHS